MAFPLYTNILTKDEIAILKEKIETLLTIKGIKIEHPKVLTLLQKAGAQVDGSNMVYFSKNIIEEALKQLPKSFVLAGVDPKFDLPFPQAEGDFYTRTNTGAMHYYTVDNQYHSIGLKEVEEWIRLSNQLENISFCALPSTSPKDVPAETIDIHTLRTVLQNTSKHTWIQPYEAANVKYLVEIAAAVAGGADQLKKRPIVSFIACSSTPFEYKYMDMEVILECCAQGIPIHACSLPTAGANAPITMPGIVLMACTEVLAMVIIAQLIAPGTPVIATPLLFAMDMMSTYTLQSPIEVTMGRMAAMQLFGEGYGIFAHTYGTGTDSFILDGQSMIERTSITQMVALSGATILGGAGQIEVAKTISPVQLIIDNDIFGMAKKLKAGLTLNDDTLAFQEILDLSGREGFIASEHTFKHFRDTFRPKSFSRDSRPSWEEKGQKDIVARAADIFYSLKDNIAPVSLPQETISEIASIVKRADSHLVGKRSNSKF